MSKLFQVQDGWPLPPISRGRKERHKWPVEAMRVGQMFFLPNRSVKSVSAYTARTTKDLPGKYAVRPCWAARGAGGVWTECAEHDVGATKGAGVWRVA